MNIVWIRKGSCLKMVNFTLGKVGRYDFNKTVS